MGMEHAGVAVGPHGRTQRPEHESTVSVASREDAPLRALSYLWIAAVQLRTTVKGAAPLDFCGVVVTRKRCPSLVTA